MGYQDRHYYRDSQSDRYSPLMWLLTGSVHLFTVSGIRVRDHVALLLFIGLTLLLGGPTGYTFSHRLISMGVLFGVILLHEFGHCFAARKVGGTAEDILLWPLGGLAEAQPPHRPLATFLTVAAGPGVNVLICAFAAVGLWTLGRIMVPTRPGDDFLAQGMNWIEPQFYLWYLYSVSYVLLLFNLLPIYPLDGGQMLQAILWRWMGYGKAMLVSCNIGIGGSILVGGYGIYNGQWLIIMVMVMCLINCIQRRSMIKAAGTWMIDEYDATEVHRPRRHHLSRYAKWRAKRQIRREEDQPVERRCHSGESAQPRDALADLVGEAHASQSHRTAAPARDGIRPALT